jgi:Fe-S cluster assembly protein SufD
MTSSDAIEALRLKLVQLPGGPEAMAQRESALAVFERTGYPTRRLEDWRYTDISRIADGDFDFAAAPSAAPLPKNALGALLRTAGLDTNAARIVIVDGYTVDRQLAGLADAGAEVLSLAKSLERFGAAAIPDELAQSPLAALNMAFASSGAHLRVSAAAALPETLHVVFAGVATSRHALQPQLVIDLERNARADVCVHFIGGDECASWMNLATRIRLGEGSQLSLSRIQRHSATQFHTELLEAIVARDATFRLTTVDLGGALVRNDIVVRLEEPGASCNLGGIAFAEGGQHVDNHVTVDHRASQSVSDQSFRSIVGSRGRAIFNGKVVVRKGTKGVSAEQASDNLLLARDGEIDTKPELEIHADDVRCAHGATVGELDESQLFYLRARGLPQTVARGLLTLAFAAQILDRLDGSALGRQVADKFGLDLPDVGGGSILE